jgi:hypothetical protein
MIVWSTVALGQTIVCLTCERDDAIFPEHPHSCVQTLNVPEKFTIHSHA